GWFAQCLEREARIQTPTSLERCVEWRQMKKPGIPGFLWFSPSRTGKKHRFSVSASADMANIVVFRRRHGALRESGAVAHQAHLRHH
ncbi:MAG: hypothetical protein ACE1ZV_02835, partial [Alphaproteobacteria bacterium]